MASVSSSPSDAYSEGLGGFLESLAASHGSLGHPQLCQRPCVHMAKRGSCSLGSACRFCHDSHFIAPLKMEKAQREIMQAMRKEDVRTLLIPHIQNRLQQLELTEKAASLLLLFGHELYSDVQHAFKDINQRDLSKLNRQDFYGPGSSITGEGLNGHRFTKQSVAGGFLYDRGMGGVFCCCEPQADEEEATLAPPPKVQVGKRGGQVKVSQDAAGILLTGKGVALAGTVIEQDAAYWEIRVLEPGTTSRSAFVGVALDLNGQRLDSKLGDGTSSWALGGDLAGGALQKNDVIGVAFGQGDIPNLRFYRNGTEIREAEVLRIRGEAFPAFSVSDGAELLVVFESSGFAQEPPGRHVAIVAPRKMI
ncbi:hypothetical protein AK812_SmicGene4258 [Symbiodinium microadriaticum]|uniref:C3H1-type domain-containing protein n=1 Tax=Symbiodinium microadriaticum TaxID=2951 RepID=A0A1Q9EWK7_SYMMI|nr:hypothetical protein AK812_SmicGene4258 [Symbiodinium microadriaticum]